MAKVTVTGHNDDLIELDGDIYKEFGYLQFDQDNGALVSFSDGIVLRVLFDKNGVWRITPVAKGTATMTLDQAPEDDEDGTDVAVLEGDIRWAVCGASFVAAQKTTGASAEPEPDVVFIVPAELIGIAQGDELGFISKQGREVQVRIPDLGEYRWLLERSRAEVVQSGRSPEHLPPVPPEDQIKRVIQPLPRSR